jgi:hypothetical protein
MARSPLASRRGDAANLPQPDGHTVAGAGRAGKSARTGDQLSGDTRNNRFLQLQLQGRALDIENTRHVG